MIQHRHLSVGPPGDKLFKQGTCKDCGIPLFGKEPISREVCGLCLTETVDTDELIRMAEIIRKTRNRK